MRISDWSSDVCSSDLGKSRVIGSEILGMDQPGEGVIGAAERGGGLPGKSGQGLARAVQPQGAAAQPAAIEGDRQPRFKQGQIVVRAATRRAGAGTRQRTLGRRPFGRLDRKSTRLTSRFARAGKQGGCRGTDAE